MITTQKIIDDLKIDLGLEQGELSFHKKHVGSTIQDETDCKQRIKLLKTKIRKEKRLVE